MNPPAKKSSANSGILLALFLAVIVTVNIVLLSEGKPSFTAVAGQLSDYIFSLPAAAGNSRPLPALVYLPAGYDEDDADRTWPVVLFLHGSWHRGNDLDLVRQSGIPRLIEDGADYPFILVAPQCPAEDRWYTEELTQLLDEVERQFRVDKDQIHVTGFELGGYGTWDLAAATPERFATAVPFGGHRPKEECRGPAPEWMSRIHLWHLYALSDEVTNSQNAVKSIHKVWEAGNTVRLTDVSEGTRVVWRDWTKIYGRNLVIEWMLRKRRKVRHHIRWTDESPAPGRQVWGELCEEENGRAGKPLLGFWLYLPPDTAATAEPAPLLLSLHGKQHAGDDPSLLLQSPLPRAIQDGTAPPSIVVSPQRRLESAWDFLLIEELLDRLDVEMPIHPYRRFLTGISDGALAAWELSVRDPFHFPSIALFDYQPADAHRQQAHRLLSNWKHFYSTDRSIAPAVDYCQLVTDMTYKKGDPTWTVSTEEDADTLAYRVCSGGELFDWFAAQDESSKRVQPNYAPMGIPYHLKMASPEVVELFERGEYRFEEHHQDIEPFVYHLHRPASMEQGKTYPLIVWLHGHGDSEHSLDAGELQWMDSMIPDPTDAGNLQFFVFALQCPLGRDWHNGRSSAPIEKDSGETITAVMEMTEKLKAEYPIDPGRISVVGISSGSQACWEILKRYPQYFAAIAPIAGEGTRNTGFADDLTGEKIWAFKGLVDGNVDGLRDTIRHVRSLGAEVRFTQVLRDAHIVWPEAFLDHHLLSWLLEQKRD